MLHYFNALFARPERHEFQELVANAGNHLKLPSHRWRDVDEQVRRYGGSHPRDIEGTLSGHPVALDEMAVALHYHALRLLPIAPEQALAELDVCAREYGNPLSFVALSRRWRHASQRSVEAWRRRLSAALTALVVASVIEECAPGNALSQEVRDAWETELSELRQAALVLGLNAGDEAERLRSHVTGQATRFRQLYGLPASQAA